jgi:hypothetical protein
MAVRAMRAMMPVRGMDAGVDRVCGRDERVRVCRGDGRGGDGGASRSCEQQDGDGSDRDGTSLHVSDGPDGYGRWVTANGPHHVR